MQALIMAGGKGTRLAALTKDAIPKPMAELCGLPVIGRAIESLRRNGVEEVFISVGHLADKIKEYVGSGARFGVRAAYVEEETPLGSGGALYYLKDKVKSDFIVCSGDTVFDIDIRRMVAFHKKKKAAATLFTHPNSHPYDSDVIVCDRYGRVKNIAKKGEPRDRWYKNNVNAGFFVIAPAALHFFTEPKKVNMEHDFIAALVKNGERVYAYKSPEYIKDVGTPERFAQAEEDVKSGLVAARNLKNRQKAVFLDRDGTLNVYKGFIRKAEDIELLSGVAEGIGLLNAAGYLTVAVSNQPVIARGEASFADVEEQFAKIETLLGEKGAYLDGVYYCPHHPDGGFAGEVKRLKKVCRCRKPDIGLFLKAQKDFNIDFGQSFVIGDADADVRAGINAGVKQIRLKTGVAEKAGGAEPTYRAKDFLSAAKMIVEEKKRL